MKLTVSQIKEYNENGYLIVDGLFSEEEVLGLRNGVLKIDDTPMPNIIREENGAIRSVFAPLKFGIADFQHKEHHGSNGNISTYDRNKQSITSRFLKSYFNQYTQL